MLCAGGQRVRDGEVITLDGATGEVFVGAVAMIEPELSGDFATLMEWADKVRRMKVRANAETPLDAETARKFGAEGIGLCRTEHMFFDPERIGAVRQMILAETERGRRAALAQLLPFQRQDFIELFRIMAGLPVTIRLLDPPLHEFLPHSDEEIAEVAAVARRRCRRRCSAARAELCGSQPDARPSRLPPRHHLSRDLRDAGARHLRGRRARSARKPARRRVPEIMIPLVATRRELEITRAQVDKVAQEVFAETGYHVEYSVGTMIELPRAALTADEIAESADFFSFGTNDLTQTTFGLSRDDAGKFLPLYVEKGILPKDPFVSIDIEGVGELVRIAAEKGRSVKPDLKLGICGEHGGDPASIAFCERSGSTTSPARPTACRSRGWRRRRRRCTAAACDRTA